MERDSYFSPVLSRRLLMRRIFFLGLWIGLLAGCAGPGPTADGTVRILWARDPETLDPLVNLNQNASDANNLLHLALLQVDYASQRYAPALADSLPRVRLLGDSVSLVTYRLRPAATWDDGRPVLARDVDFTLKLMQVPACPTRTQRPSSVSSGPCAPTRPTRGGSPWCAGGRHRILRKRPVIFLFCPRQPSTRKAACAPTGWPRLLTARSRRGPTRC